MKKKTATRAKKIRTVEQIADDIVDITYKLNCLFQEAFDGSEIRCYLSAIAMTEDRPLQLNVSIFGLVKSLGVIDVKIKGVEEVGSKMIWKSVTVGDDENTV